MRYLFQFLFSKNSKQKLAPILNPENAKVLGIIQAFWCIHNEVKSCLFEIERGREGKRKQRQQKPKGMEKDERLFMLHMPMKWNILLMLRNKQAISALWHRIKETERVLDA